MTLRMEEHFAQMIRSVIVTSLITVYFLNGVICPPVTQPPPPPPAESEEDDSEQSKNMGLEYERYLKEVVGVLESDEGFRKKLEESNISEIQLSELTYDKYLQEVMGLLMTDTNFANGMMKTAGGNKTPETGEIAKHLDFVGHGIRTKLDEIKRKELDRLRQIMRLKAYLQNSLRASHPNIDLPEIDKERVLGHLDHANPNSFEVSDLAKLIQKASKDLGDIDRKRKEEFKNYEMEKEHLRRQQLQSLNESQRVEEEKKFEEMQKKHDDHPKLHHPGNEEQLKEVWEESDGLNKNDFDPKTFFHLHDTNGDGFLDAAEVEALFQKELDKAYDPNAPEDDMLERYEEMNRMREHFVNEVDQNKDSMISMQEFIENTEKEEFKKDEEWEPLDSEDVFKEEELVAFEKNYDNVLQQKELEEEKLKKIRMNLDRIGQSTMVPPNARQNEQVGRHGASPVVEKQDGQRVVQEQQQHVQQPAQHPVQHEQPLVHGQQNGHQQPVQHMQQQQQQHHEQPVVHEQPIAQQQPVVHEQPNVQDREQHGQQPVVIQQQEQQPVAIHEQPAADEQQHVQQPVVIEQQHEQQPVHVQDAVAPAADDAQAQQQQQHEQPLVFAKQPQHQEAIDGGHVAAQDPDTPQRHVEG